MSNIIVEDLGPVARYPLLLRPKAFSRPHEMPFVDIIVNAQMIEQTDFAAKLQEAIGL